MCVDHHTPSERLQKNEIHAFSQVTMSKHKLILDEYTLQRFKRRQLLMIILRG